MSCNGGYAAVFDEIDFGCTAYYSAGDEQLVAAVASSANFRGSETCVGVSERFVAPSCEPMADPCKNFDAGADGSDDSSSSDDGLGLFGDGALFDGAKDGGSADAAADTVAQ